MTEALHLEGDRVQFCSVLPSWMHIEAQKLITSSRDIKSIKPDSASRRKCTLAQKHTSAKDKTGETRTKQESDRRISPGIISQSISLLTVYQSPTTLPTVFFLILQKTDWSWKLNVSCDTNYAYKVTATTHIYVCCVYVPSSVLFLAPSVHKHLLNNVHNLCLARALRPGLDNFDSSLENQCRDGTESEPEGERLLVVVVVVAGGMG